MTGGEQTYGRKEGKTGGKVKGKGDGRGKRGKKWESFVSTAKVVPSGTVSLVLPFSVSQMPTNPRQYH